MSAFGSQWWEGLAVSEFLQGSSDFKLPTLEGFSQMSTVQIVIVGVVVDGIFEGTGDWGPSLTLICFTLSGTTAVVAGKLERLDRKFRSFKLRGIIGSCLALPYRKVGSLGSDQL